MMFLYFYSFGSYFQFPVTYMTTFTFVCVGIKMVVHERIAKIRRCNYCEIIFGIVNKLVRKILYDQCPVNDITCL